MPAVDVGRPVGVVGAGVMGSGIAQVAAVAGHQVLLHDVDPLRARGSASGTAERLRHLADKGRLDEAQAHAAAARVTVVASLAELAPAGLVIEAAAESLPVKQDIFAQLEAAVPAGCILATNTSSLSVTAIAAPLRQPGRVVGMHFFNPAPVMTLVEVVSGLATDPRCAGDACDTARAWGKVAVHVRSTPGFIVNRVARPFYAEALRAVEERTAEPATIDAVMRDAGGFPMGPLELIDLIGQDVNEAVTRSLWKAFHHDARYRPSLHQRTLVEGGLLGRKTGRGLYDYRPDAPVPIPQTAPPRSAPGCVDLVGDLGPAAALVDRLRDAGVTVQAGPAPPVGDDGWLRLPAGARLQLTDGALATQHAARAGEPVILADLALDYGRADRLGLAASDGCPPAALSEAVGLLQAAGADVSVLDDVPGLLVMRTVAMLVNEAADAVAGGVADATAVDLAMRHGVNYPLGPLAWGDRLGSARVVAVLDNLDAVHRDGRYRACVALRRHALVGRRLGDS